MHQATRTSLHVKGLPRSANPDTDTALEGLIHGGARHCCSNFFGTARGTPRPDARRMSLLLDQNLSRRLVSRIADKFPGTLHVGELGMECKSDGDIWD